MYQFPLADVAAFLLKLEDRPSKPSHRVHPSVVLQALCPRAHAGPEEAAEDETPTTFAHLLGMGDASFWISLIEVVIPNIYAAADADHTYVEAYPQAEPPTHATCLTARPLSADAFAAKYPESQGTSFTYDVVYDLESLARALGLEVTAGRPAEQLQQEIAGRLPVRGAKNWQSGLVRPYTVWSARTQSVEPRVGITNTDLCVMLQKPQHRTEIQNSFERQGDHQRGDAFWQQFDPQWLPRSDILKDCMCSQYPVLLDLLLDDVLLRNHERTGVRHAEFSVGSGDILERPWIFKHLVAPSVPKEFGGPLEPCAVELCYLAALDRDGENVATYVLP